MDDAKPISRPATSLDICVKSANQIFDSSSSLGKCWMTIYVIIMIIIHIILITVTDYENNNGESMYIIILIIIVIIIIHIIINYINFMCKINVQYFKEKKYYI